MPASRKPKSDETDETTDTPDTGHESQADEVGGHWEDDDTTGDRRWVPDQPKQ